MAYSPVSAPQEAHRAQGHTSPPHTHRGTNGERERERGTILDSVSSPQLMLKLQKQTFSPHDSHLWNKANITHAWELARTERRGDVSAITSKWMHFFPHLVQLILFLCCVAAAGLHPLVLKPWHYTSPFNFCVLVFSRMAFIYCAIIKELPCSYVGLRLKMIMCMSVLILLHKHERLWHAHTHINTRLKS